tara:strand:- start:238 stop:447 length:210 start_codon:yes stop_codon:yes gene_type:complete
MNNLMTVNTTAAQKLDTKKAMFHFSYGGKIEIETSPNVWVHVTTPLDLLRADTENFDITKLKHNYRPKV